jgi:hypothetical protein
MPDQLRGAHCLQSRFGAELRKYRFSEYVEEPLLFVAVHIVKIDLVEAAAPPRPGSDRGATQKRVGYMRASVTAACTRIAGW